MRGDCIFVGDSISVRAMARPDGSMPACDWVSSLDSRGKGQLIAVCRVMDHSITSGRPPAGRSGPVHVSRCGLHELKVTAPGGSGPHLRLLYLRLENTLWVADGFKKQKNRLSRADVLRTDNVAREWLDSMGKENGV